MAGPRFAALALALALAAAGAWAQQAAPARPVPPSAEWPPSAEVAARMKSLQEKLHDANATAAQREAAREELAGLLKSPAGQARGRTPDEKPPRPARAAIAPLPSVVKPVDVTPRAAPPAEGVARLEVIDPPRPVVVPRTGVATSPPSRGFAIDPRTGTVLHEVPGGLVDPASGRFIPR